MASTIDSVMDAIKFRMKITVSNTDRDTELISYLNTIHRGALMPLLLRHGSDLGQKEWDTTETIANVRKVALPTDIAAFGELYCIDSETTGTADSGSGTSIVLASSATTGTTSSTDDAYNTFNIRATGGTGDGQQFAISDYDGGTRTITTSTSITTGFGADTTYIIFQEPTDAMRLSQKTPRFVRDNYNGIGKPEVFAMDLKDSIKLGNIPGEVYALQGWYYNLPTAFTTSTDALPYDQLFDELFIQFGTLMALNTDEYGHAKFDDAMLGQIADAVLSIIRFRGPRGIEQAPIYGSELFYTNEEA